MRLDFEVSHSQKFEKYVAEDDVDCNYRASLCVCVVLAVLAVHHWRVGWAKGQNPLHQFPQVCSKFVTSWRGEKSVVSEARHILYNMVGLDL